MTGYQQAILYLNGSMQNDTPGHGLPRFIVRNVDRFYVDAVAELFSTKSYYQHCSAPGKRDYWCIKDAATAKPALSDISDWHGFSPASDLWPDYNAKG